MSAFKRYAQYKASGVEWLGEVPEHWETWKVTHGFHLIGSGTTPKSDNADLYDGDTPWVTTSELRESVIYDTAQKVSDDAIDQYSALKKYPVGSVAIAMYGATIGRLGILGVEATFNQACCVFAKPIVFYNRFFYYWLWMRRPILISLSNGGGQPNLSQDDLKKIWIPAPSITEQTAIAQFLDQKTAQIDALIAKKQQLLDKLAEQRTALISHAVTKGLDPNAPMKDSGVAWLGEVPEHWNTIRVKYISGFLTSGPRGWSDYIHESGLCIFLQSGDMNDNLEILTDKAKRITPPDGAEGVRTLLLPNDVIVCITGANTGRVAVVDYLPVTTYINQHLSLIRPKSNIVNSKYLALLLASDVGRTYFNIHQSGLKEGLNLRDIAEAPAVIPTLAEQQEIVDHLDQKISQLNEMSDKVQAVIDKLKEYRAALITQAVTGQIDVSGLSGV